MNKVQNFFTSYPARAASVAGWYQMICSTGGSVISIPFVVGSLSVDAAGMWFTLQAIIAIFLLSDFGFSMAISRQVAHSFKLDKDIVLIPSDFIQTDTGWKGAGALYAASKIIFMRVTMVSMILFIISYELILPHTNILVNSTTETKTVWYLLAASFAFIFQARLSQSFLDGLGYMYISRIVSGTYQLLCGIFSAVALWLGFGLLGLGVVLFIASILQLIAMQFSLRRISSGNLILDYTNVRPLISSLWKVAVPFGLVISGAYLVGAAQIPLIGMLLGPAVVTSIYMAFKISQALNGFVLQLVTAQLPFFTQLCAKGYWLDARRLMIRTIAIGSLLQIAIGISIYFISPKLVDLWVGPGRYIDGNVLLVFTLNYVITCMAGLPAQFVLAAGRNPFALSTILHGVLTISGMLIICPIEGLVGVPLASLIAVLLTNFWLNPLEALRTWNSLNKMGAS